MVEIFSIFLLQLEIFCQNRFQKLTLLDNWILKIFFRFFIYFFFLSYRVIYFRNKLSNQIKNSNRIENFKIKLDGFRKENGTEKNLSGHFWETIGWIT